MKILSKDIERAIVGSFPSVSQLSPSRVKKMGLTMLESPEEEEQVSQAIAIQLVEALECLSKEKEEDPKKAAKIFTTTGRLIGELYVKGGLTNKEFARREKMARFLQAGPCLGEGTGNFRFDQIAGYSQQMANCLKDYASGTKKVKILRGRANPLYQIITCKMMADILIYCFPVKMLRENLYPTQLSLF